MKKEQLRELKKFKVQTISVSDYKKRNDRNIFNSSTKLIASYLDIDEAFKSMQQSIMKKIKKFCLGRLDCLKSNYKNQY